MSERIVKVLISRKTDNNHSVLLLTDTSTGKAQRFIIDNSQYNTREYMTYLLAVELSKLEKELASNPDNDNRYTFITAETLKGLNRPANRLHYVTTRTNKNGTPLSDSFVKNIHFIHSALERLGDKVIFTTTNLAIPHEYNGRKLGSKFNAEAIDKSWKLMDTMVPKIDRSLGDFELE